jgi:hypothetical protein
MMMCAELDQRGKKIYTQSIYLQLKIFISHILQSFFSFFFMTDLLFELWKKKLLILPKYCNVPLPNFPFNRIVQYFNVAS